jgi:hypothetical protein
LRTQRQYRKNQQEREYYFASPEHLYFEYVH